MAAQEGNRICNMSPGAALTNTVNPLVSREKFPDDVDYEAVFLQPARLVSHLLRTPQATHNFLAMIQTAPHRSELQQDPAGQGRYSYREVQNIHELRRADYLLVGRTLEHVARTVTWCVRKMTTYGARKKLPKVLSTQSIYSARSMININERFCRALTQAQDDHKKKLSLQFLLAVTMIHELAHAIMHNLTETLHEHTFGTRGSGEAGFELEAHLFGLCPSEERSYSGDLHWYELGISQQLEKWWLQPVPIEQVQIGFIQALFTDWFWRWFSPQAAWTMIPTAAWQPIVYVLYSISCLILTATMQFPRRQIAGVVSSSRKRKRRDDDDGQKQIAGVVRPSSKRERRGGDGGQNDVIVVGD